MIKIDHILICIILLLSINGFSQKTKVYGTVTDAETGEKLPFVNVIFQGSKIGTTTDLDGKYEIKLGNLEATRDFSYVIDTVDGIIAGMNSSSNLGKVVNLGAGFEISILKTAKIISDITGREIKIITDEQRVRPKESEVNRLYSDNSLAKELLNWSPKYSGEEGFVLGLKKTIEWFAIPENRKNYKTNLYNQ